MTFDLYVLVRQSDNQLVWSAVTTKEDAERIAVMAAVNTGAVKLLNGWDLIVYLTERNPES